MWAFSFSTESYLQKKLATSLALRHVQHRQPPGTHAAMHDPILYSTDDGKLTLQLRACVWANQQAFAKRLISLPIRSTPYRGAPSPATIKQSLTVQPVASRQISRSPQRDAALAVRQP